MANPLGYQQITDLTASVGLTLPSSNTQRPASCRIVCEAQAVRWRDDGTAPTATVGQPLAVGTELIYDGDLKAIRFFEQAPSAKLNISYYYP